MTGLVERALDALFDHQLILDGCEADIPDPARPVYLKRYFLVVNDDPNRSARWSLTVHRKANGRQVYLHKICRSDGAREMHDHPWDFTSLILWRGYIEETAARIKWRGACGKEFSVRGVILSRKWPGFILRRRAEYRHRVLLSGGPAWTLVLTSGKKRSWGFWRRGAFIPWREFISRKCGGK